MSLLFCFFLHYHHQIVNANTGNTRLYIFLKPRVPFHSQQALRSQGTCGPLRRTRESCPRCSNRPLQQQPHRTRSSWRSHHETSQSQSHTTPGLQSTLAATYSNNMNIVLPPLCAFRNADDVRLVLIHFQESTALTCWLLFPSSGQNNTGTSSLLEPRTPVCFRPVEYFQMVSLFCR